MGKKKEKSVDRIKEVEEAINEERWKIASRDWFDLELREKAKSQLHLAEKAMSMDPPLPSPAKAHLKEISSAISCDERRREDHEKENALRAAVNERDQLIATLAIAGISAIPLEVFGSYLKWPEVQKGFLGRTKEIRQTCTATHYPLDSDGYKAEEPFYAMVRRLRGLGVEDEQMCVFQEKKADPILAIRIREKPPNTWFNEPYVLVTKW